jgi:hypothetical protein
MHPLPLRNPACSSLAACQLHQLFLEKTNRLCNFANQVGLKISQTKTEVITLNITNPTPIELDLSDLKKFLGLLSLFMMSFPVLASFRIVLQRYVNVSVFGRSFPSSSIGVGLVMFNRVAYYLLCYMDQNAGG